MVAFSVRTTTALLPLLRVTGIAVKVWFREKMTAAGDWTERLTVPTKPLRLEIVRVDVAFSRGRAVNADGAAVILKSLGRTVTFN